MLHARRLLTYLRPYRWHFGAGTIAAAVASTLDGITLALFIPFFRVLFGNQPILPDSPTGVEKVTGWLVAIASPVEPLVGPLFTIVGLIALAVLLKNAAGYLSSYVSMVIEERVTRDLRVTLHDKLQTLKVTALQSMKTGDLLNRVVSDVDHVKSFIGVGLQTVVRNGVLIIVYIAILFGLDWRLAAVTLLLAAAIAVGMTPLLKKIRSLFTRVFRTRGDASARLLESVEGARVIKAHGAEEYESTKFRRLLDRVVHDRLHAERYALLASPMSEVLGMMVFVTLLVLGTSVGFFETAVRPEVFVGFTAVTLRLLSPLKKLAHFPTIAEQAGVAAGRVFELLDNERTETPRGRLREFDHLKNKIEFEGVWFAYTPGHWVLRDVNLEIARGEVVAIVGSSGTGKSTLVDLLPRFIDPVRGAVRIDGVNTTSYDAASLRKNMAVVNQDTMLFNDTILANIAFGDACHATRDEVERVAHIANAHEFIQRLPNGYDTRVGDRGVLLSGGERQRVAIARALLRDAPILILDEATSALDPSSDRLVRDAVANLMTDRTVLVVAHRAETIARADRVVTLDRGQVVWNTTPAVESLTGIPR